MRMLNKVLIGAAIASVFGLGAVVASGPSNSVEPIAPAVDISGPCDEAENATDPRCAGAEPLEGDTPAAVDISGPCDEAEHVNDPRCAGAGDRDDNSGPGNGDRDSGPGSGDDDGDENDDRDNSGPGSGDDDGEGNGDHDNSGPGSGDDD